MAATLQLSQALVDQMIEHCRSRHPKEACGMLAGKGLALQSGSVRIATAIYPMTNVEDSPIGYSMEPREQLRVMKEMRQRNQHMLCIYHSHTASAAYPSSVDVSLAISPEISYALVSLKDPEHPDLKSYRIDGQRITPEEIRVAP